MVPDEEYIELDIPNWIVYVSQTVNQVRGYLWLYQKVKRQKLAPAAEKLFI